MNIVELQIISSEMHLVGKGSQLYIYDSIIHGMDKVLAFDQ